MAATVSCVIRAYNEEQWIGKLLDSLGAQESYAGSLEVIVVDSGSTDRTAQIAGDKGARVISIRKEHFTYSSALNRGIAECTGSLVVILSAHSIPGGPDWLGRMVGRFGADERVAGVYCRQVPWPDALCIETVRVRKRFSDRSQVFCDGDLRGMCFSNAGSCIRRSTWQSHPFVELPAAEDREWALWSISQGFKIVYEASACIYHSHNDSARQAAQRQIQLERGLDCRIARKRSRILTLRQTAGMMVRGIRLIGACREHRHQRLKSLAHVFGQSYWYLKDFDKR